MRAFLPGTSARTNDFKHDVNIPIYQTKEGRQPITVLAASCLSDARFETWKKDIKQLMEHRGMADFGP